MVIIWLISGLPLRIAKKNPEYLPLGNGIIKNLQVKSDRYGILPLFYLCDKREIIISTSPLKILDLGIPADLNDEALSVFLYAGYFIGNDTPFRSIKRVPAASVMEWSNRHGLVITGAEVPESDRAEITRDAAIDGYIQLFRQSIARCVAVMEDPIVLPLSGGQDSRHILFELCHQGEKPEKCVTFRFPPPGYIDDYVIATTLCSRIQVPHRVLPHVAGRFRAEERKNLLTGFLSKEHAQGLALDICWDGRSKYVLDGLGGDVLSAATFWNDPVPNRLYAEKRLDMLADYLMDTTQAPLAHVDANTIQKILGPRWGRKVVSKVARERIIQELEKHKDKHNPLRSFYIANRTTRDAGLFFTTLLPTYVKPLFPYFDHALYDFLASLPYEMLADGQFHKDTIKKGFPQYVDVPYAQKEPTRNVKSYWIPFHARLLVNLLLFPSRRALLNMNYILPRVVRSCVTGRPGHFFEFYLVYMSQLSSHVSGCGAIDTGSRKDRLLS